MSWLPEAAVVHSSDLLNDEEETKSESVPELESKNGFLPPEASADLPAHASAELTVAATVSPNANAEGQKETTPMKHPLGGDTSGYSDEYSTYSDYDDYSEEEEEQQQQQQVQADGRRGKAALSKLSAITRSSMAMQHIQGAQEQQKIRGKKRRQRRRERHRDESYSSEDPVEIQFSKARRTIARRKKSVLNAKLNALAKDLDKRKAAVLAGKQAEIERLEQEMAAAQEQARLTVEAELKRETENLLRWHKKRLLIKRHQCQPEIGVPLLLSESADLGAEAKRMLMYGADYLHLDVMDGHFVPYLGLSPRVIKNLRALFPREKGENFKTTYKPPYFDCHMLVAQPLKWVDIMSESGADRFTFHLEAVKSGTIDPVKGGEGGQPSYKYWKRVDSATHMLIKRIRAKKMQVGIAINPQTPFEEVVPYLYEVDMVLFCNYASIRAELYLKHPMTIENPIRDPRASEPTIAQYQKMVLQEIKDCRQWANEEMPELSIAVEGGVRPGVSVDEAAKAGANMIIAPAADIFSSPDDGKAGDLRDPAEVFRDLRDAVSHHGLGKRRYRFEAPSKSKCGRFSRPTTAIELYKRGSEIVYKRTKEEKAADEALAKLREEDLKTKKLHEKVISSSFFFANDEKKMNEPVAMKRKHLAHASTRTTRGGGVHNGRQRASPIDYYKNSAYQQQQFALFGAPEAKVEDEEPEANAESEDSNDSKACVRHESNEEEEGAATKIEAAFRVKKARQDANDKANASRDWAEGEVNDLEEKTAKLEVAASDIESKEVSKDDPEGQSSGAEGAATKIEAAFRGKKVRKGAKEGVAATKIEAAFRGKQARKGATSDATLDLSLSDSSSDPGKDSSSEPRNDSESSTSGIDPSKVAGVEARPQDREPDFDLRDKEIEKPKEGEGDDEEEEEEGEEEEEEEESSGWTSEEGKPMNMGEIRKAKMEAAKKVLQAGGSAKEAELASARIELPVTDASYGREVMESSSSSDEDMMYLTRGEKERKIKARLLAEEELDDKAEDEKLITSHSPGLASHFYSSSMASNAETIRASAARKKERANREKQRKSSSLWAESEPESN